MAGGGVTRDLEAVTTHLSADLQLPKHPLMKTITIFHHRNTNLHYYKYHLHDGYDHHHEHHGHHDGHHGR